MNKEIERKYAIDKLPSEIKITKINNIEQAFIYSDGNTIVRIRKNTNMKENTIEYIYTVKTTGDIQYKNNSNIGQKYEIEKNISCAEYEKLIQKKISNIINKTRVVMPIENNLKVEIDIYHDYLEGFLTAEIEFPNEEEANKFNKPNWLGKELGYKELSNRKLAEMTKEEFKRKVSEEAIEKNKKIISQLNDILQKSY